ncbi:MAG: LPS export ABC transporter permease LptG [Sneathiellaceae bacterium]
MQLSRTLSMYFGRQYLAGFGSVFAVLLALTFIFDMVEMLRRAGKRDDVGLDMVVEMSLLKLPALSLKLLPFAALFGAMLVLSRLTRTNELTVARAAGISAWQFLMPALAIAFLIGVFTVTVYNPVASTLVARYELLEAKHLKGRASALAVSETGFWLRDSEGSSQSVVHALRMAQKDVELRDVILFFYKGDDRFVQRIDAISAKLEPGQWKLTDAVITGPNQAPEYQESMVIPTSMTASRIQDSFASPETISFWALPRFISTLEDAGFSAVRHRLHFYALLAIPLLLCAMVLLAATCSLRLTRTGRTGLLLAAGVAIGFLFYFLSDLVSALGISGSLPPVLAALAPTAICLLLGMAMLFHLEDG